MNRLIAALLSLTLVLTAAAPAYAYTDQEQQEMQIGQQVYQQLQQKGEIVTSSPYYTTLNSIAARIKSAADPKYYVPFRFILVNESQPNAFSVPGGNVYVTTSMMKFVQNKEELAGVLCHEVNHDLHHDVYNLYAKEQRLSLYAGIASLLLGRNSGLINGAINMGANLEALHFSRDVEHNADHGGAYTCAQAGITPWGMVWLMKQFEANPSGGASPEFLSDHPSDSHRVDALQAEFAADPATFARFNQNIACSTPVSAAGWNNQYQGGCGRRQSGSTSSSPRKRNVAHHIAPVSTAAKAKCQPGWKYC